MVGVGVGVGVNGLWKHLGFWMGEVGNMPKCVSFKGNAGDEVSYQQALRETQRNRFLKSLPKFVL